MPASASRLRAATIGFASSTFGPIRSATVLLRSSPSRVWPAMTKTRRSPSSRLAATSWNRDAGAFWYSGAIRSANQSGRNSAKVAASNSRTSHQRHFVRM